GITHEGNQPHGVVTLSIGGAVVQEEILNTRFDSYQDLQEAMFNAADKALYQCKQQGRNRVLWSSSLDSNSK
ncbi:GGDEF domain-containing protein, partial [Vibrio sp. M260118]